MSATLVGDVEGGAVAHATPGVQQHKVACAGTQQMQSQSSPLTSWLHSVSESCTTAQSGVFRESRDRKTLCHFSILEQVS